MENSNNYFSELLLSSNMRQHKMKCIQRIEQPRFSHTLSPCTATGDLKRLDYAFDTYKTNTIKGKTRDVGLVLRYQ